MTSPETPPQEPTPPRSVIGGVSWKVIVPAATLLSIFLGVLGGMLAYFDNRFTVGIAGLRTELAATEQRLTAQIVEVKADLRATESRLSGRIDEVKADLGTRIDEVKADLGARIDEVKAELAASEARRAAVDERLSADIERVAAGVAENRAAHRELAGFVRASWNREPPPATTEQGNAPAQ